MKGREDEEGVKRKMRDDDRGRMESEVCGMSKSREETLRKTKVEQRWCREEMDG